jgi:mRNA interferase MazF
MFNNTRVESRELIDLLIEPTDVNGIKKRSLIRTGKIATLDKSLAKGALGSLTKTELAILNEKLKLFLQIP